MNREDVDLSFFYEVSPCKSAFSHDETFCLKMTENIEHCLPFFRENALSDILFVLIRLFKDDYPNAFPYVEFLFGCDSDKLSEDGNRMIFKIAELHRDDISEVLLHYHLIPDFTDKERLLPTPCVFLEKLEITFAENNFDKEIVVKAFNGDVYLQERDGKAIFKTINSPISQIIAEDGKFTMMTNPESYRSYE